LTFVNGSGTVVTNITFLSIDLRLNATVDKFFY